MSRSFDAHAEAEAHAAPDADRPEPPRATTLSRWQQWCRRAGVVGPKRRRLFVRLVCSPRAVREFQKALPPE